MRRCVLDVWRSASDVCRCIAARRHACCGCAGGTRASPRTRRRPGHLGVRAAHVRVKKRGPGRGRRDGRGRGDGALTLNHNVDNTRRSGGLNRVRTDLRTEPFGGHWRFTSGGARRSRRRLEVGHWTCSLWSGSKGQRAGPLHEYAVYAYDTG